MAKSRLIADCTKDLLDRFHGKARGSGMKMGPALIRLAEDWINEDASKGQGGNQSGNTSTAPQPQATTGEALVPCLKKHAADHEKLEKILKLGGPKRVLGIRSNLDAFVGDMTREQLEGEAVSPPKKRAG